LRRFTKSTAASRIDLHFYSGSFLRLIRPLKGGSFMVATSGELIRMMNYVDDIATTLRRIVGTFPFLTEEEKKRLAEYMRKADPNFMGVIEQIERGGK